jgi:hypothetical protein
MNAKQRLPRRWLRVNDCSCFRSDFVALAIGQCEPIGIEEKAAVGL